MNVPRRTDWFAVFVIGGLLAIAGISTSILLWAIVSR